MENCKVRLEVSSPESEEKFTILVPQTLDFQKVASLLTTHIKGGANVSEECMLVLSKAGKALSFEMNVGESQLRNGDEIVITWQ